MVDRPISHGHFISSERSPIGAVTLAGRHFDLPRVPPKTENTLSVYAAVLVIAGRAVHENATGAREPVKPGDVMLIFPGVSYRYSQPTPGPWSEWWTHFEGPAFDLLRDRGVISPERPVIRAGSPRYWLRRFDAMTSGSERGQPRPGAPSQLRRVGMLQQVLAELLEHEQRLQTSPKDEAWLAQINEHFEPRPSGERPDWKKIARQAGLSYEGFRKRFAKLTGVPPSKHYHSRVMQRACDLLRNADLSLAEIADACGFCDQFQFSRQFQKHIGIAPSQYRKRFLVS